MNRLAKSLVTALYSWWGGHEYEARRGKNSGQRCTSWVGKTLGEGPVFCKIQLLTQYFGFFKVMYTRVQRLWLFYRKLRKQTLWWVHILNLRHIYLMHFLVFSAVFAHLASKFEKSTNMTPKNSFLEIIKIGTKKRRISC